MKFCMHLVMHVTNDNNKQLSDRLAVSLLGHCA